jgi:hypothetical protein
MVPVTKEKALFLMDPLTRLLLYVFIAGSMLGIGLKAGKAELLSVFRDKSWILRALVADFILIPGGPEPFLPLWPDRDRH